MTANGDGRKKRGAVYFGDMLYVIAHGGGGYYAISESYLQLPTTNQLLERKRAIESERIRLRNFIRRMEQMCGKDDHQAFLKETYALKDEDDALEAEHRFIIETLYGRILTRGLEAPDMGKKKIFICHSSKDKGFVRRVADDLRIRGHCLWFDETRIAVGDSIPREIQKGLQESSHLIVFLSKNAVASAWVEVEWIGKFWEEVNSRRKIVIPALIEECDIPFFLRTKKYANFPASYEEALTDLVKAITC